MRRLLLPLVLAMCVFPLAFARYYAGGYFQARAGKDLEAQRASLITVPWFQSDYRRVSRALRAALGEDAGLFIEPNRLAEGRRSTGGRTRWFLYLANDLYPLRVYVREPKLASGTMVDYPVWMNLHFETLDVDGSGLSLGGALKAEELRKAALAELDARGVEWRLTYPISTSFQLKGVHLYRRDREQPGGWLELDLRRLLDTGQLLPKGAAQ